MAKDFLATQTRVYKIIASGSGPSDKAKLLVYGVDSATNYDGGISQAYFNTSSIGNDVFLFVSGSKGAKGSATNKISVFGGDLFVSGVLYAEMGYSGSHTRLLSGLPFIAAGPGITIATNSLGQIEISGSSTATSGSIITFGISDFATTVQSTYQAVGQLIFNASQYTGSIYLRSVLSTTNASYSASIMLYNITSNAFVDINGVGNKVISTTSTTPTIKTSVDLRNATNFSAGESIYELQLAAQSTTDAVYLGGAEFRVTGSVGAQAAATSTAYFLSNSAYPDTGLPRLAYTDLGKITIVPDKTSNEAPTYLTKTIRTTFQDGIQRVHTGSVAMFLSSTLNGQGGLDNGSTIASTGEGWYYVYLVPSGSNTSTGSLSVIASRQCPTGSTAWGPTGYSNFRYIGPVFWATTGKGTPGFEPFFQSDSKTFSFLNQSSEYNLYNISNALPTSSVNVTVGAGVVPLPTTVSKIFANLEQYHTGAAAHSILFHQIFLPLAHVLGYQSYFDFSTNGPSDRRFVSVELPVGYPLESQPFEITHKTFWYSGAPASTTNNITLRWNGFEDGFLDTARIGPTTNTASIGVGSLETTATVTTSVGVTSKTIYSYFMPQDSVIDFEASFVARGQTNIFNRARYRRNFLAYRSGASNATIQGGTVYATVSDVETLAAYDVNIWTNGNNIIFDVTASSDEGANWKMTLKGNQV